MRHENSSGASRIPKLKAGSTDRIQKLRQFFTLKASNHLSQFNDLELDMSEHQALLVLWKLLRSLFISLLLYKNSFSR